MFLPNDILIEVLPFFDYVYDKYGAVQLNRIYIDKLFYETDLCINSTHYCISGHTVHKLKPSKMVKLIQDIEMFNNINKLVNIVFREEYHGRELEEYTQQFEIQYKNKEQIVYNIPQSIFFKENYPKYKKMIFRNYFQFDDNGKLTLKENTNYKLLREELIAREGILQKEGDVYNLSYNEYSIKFIVNEENNTKPEYSPYVVPIQGVELLLKISMELQKYLINDLVILVIKHYGEFVLMKSKSIKIKN